MGQNIVYSFLVAGIVRCFLITSNFAQSIRNRVEISTPLNSWKRSMIDLFLFFCGWMKILWLNSDCLYLIYLFSVQEGAFLYKNNVNPYSGDLYHENPLILYASNFLIQNAGAYIPYIFVACDLFCAFLLYRMAKELIPQMVSGLFSWHVSVFYQSH